ncbi:MAG: HD domain-containing protein [Clostridia bacterium]|nr:HD domain-containing protein [Clostridia bacterium]
MALKAFRTSVMANGEMYVYDPIHGTYYIKMPYSMIVQTQEMQRLKEITQTGFSYLDYPNMAYEDRLSHSCGAYHIMEKILDKLTLLLEDTKVEISKDDREVALCAILLHDIGHGPFSHCFETISKYSHEKRTTDILLGDTEVNKVLVELFGVSKTRRIASFIAEIDESESKDGAFVDTSFTRLIKSLISHQIDADRLDYLVRDAYYAGIESSINVDKIIDSISITMNTHGDFEVIMDKRNLTLIETPLIERFQHYRDIYFTFGSVVGDRIFRDVVKLMDRYNEEELLKKLPSEFKALIKNPTRLELSDFLLLTDKKVLKFLELVSEESKIPEIRHMANIKEAALSYTAYEDVFLRDRIENLMKKLLNKTDLVSDDSIYEIYAKTKFYKKDEGFKIRSNKRIVDLTDVTNLVNARDYVEMKCTAFNDTLFYYENGLQDTLTLDEFKELVGKHINEIHIKEQEFELKYLTNDSSNVFIGRLIAEGYELLKVNDKKNIDSYFDTKALGLYKEGKILRIRSNGKKEAKYYGTYKAPLNEGEIYTSRVEIEEELDDSSFSNLTTKMKERGVVLPEEIVKDPILAVSNQRKEYILQKNNGKVSFCFDDVTYQIPDMPVAKEIMIEVEAFNDTIDRMLLTEINEIMQKTATNYGIDLEITHMSKYQRGILRVMKKG